MKFPNAFCSTNRSSQTVEDFLLSHDETNEQHLARNAEHYAERNAERNHNNGTNTVKISNDTHRDTHRDIHRDTHRNRNPSAGVTPQKNHISRRWCYITPKEEHDNNFHKVMFEAPFVRMKEIHITPPRLPIREDSKKIRLAETKKEEGNKFYRQKRYSDALKQYAGAIELCPNVASYYGNRSACYMMIGKFKEALEDAQTAVRLDSTFIKGHLRESKCHVMTGDISAAKRSLNIATQLEPNNPSILQEMKNLDALKKNVDDADKYANKKDYRSALYNIERALEKTEDCVRFKVTRAEYLALLGRNSESQEITNDILRFDNLNVDALYVRGLSLYYQDNVEKAFAHFQQVLRLCPDHNKAKDAYKKAKSLMSKKQEGNDAYKNNKIQEAYDIYTAALQIDPLNSLTNAKLYFNRALVNTKRNQLKDGVDDCTKALELDPNYIKAYLKRAKLYLDLEMYDESVRDYETIYKKEKTKEHKQLLESAKLELKKSKRKDYYKILGINRDAGDDDIKKAYRKRAMIHHPDRHSNASETERKEQEKKFKELGEAYSVLSDPRKKSRYDSGVDIEENGFDGFADIDPNNIFQAFFQHGGGSQQFHNFTFHSGGGHSGGGHHHGPSFGFNNFPF